MKLGCLHKEYNHREALRIYANRIFFDVKALVGTFNKENP